MGNQIDTQFTLPVQAVQSGFGGHKEDRSSEKRIANKYKRTHQKNKKKQHQEKDDRLDAYA